MKKIFKVILILLFIFIPFKIADLFMDEDRNYDLNAEMLSLVRDLDEYKKKYKEYPKRVLDVRKSEYLCVTKIYPKCQKVFYNPIGERQDFRLALHSFSWPILWYKSGVCLDTHEPGGGYWFCAAYPEGSKPAPDASFPVYREDKEIFDNPKEWPIL